MAAKKSKVDVTVLPGHTTLTVVAENDKEGSCERHDL